MGSVLLLQMPRGRAYLLEPGGLQSSGGSAEPALFQTPL